MRRRGRDAPWPPLIPGEIELAVRVEADTFLPEEDRLEGFLGSREDPRSQRDLAARIDDPMPRDARSFGQAVEGVPGEAGLTRAPGKGGDLAVRGDPPAGDPGRDFPDAAIEFRRSSRLGFSSRHTVPRMWYKGTGRQGGMYDAGQLRGEVPEIGEGTYVHPSADLFGDVEIGRGCWVGPGARLRGDYGASGSATGRASRTTA